MQRADRQDVRTVQALRGLACALVVAYHAVESWGAATLTPVPADAVWPNGAAGVDIFFVISGFVMAAADSGPSGAAGAWRFLIRRCRRLVPLYWLMTCTKLALLAVSGRAACSVWHAAASLLFIPSRDSWGVVRPVLGVGWTLQFEMLFYALFALALALRRPRLQVMLAVLVPLAVAGFYRRADWPAPLVMANGLVLEFCLGVGVAWACRVWRPRPAVSASVLVGGLLLLLTLPPPGPWRFLAWGVPAALVVAGAVWLEPVCGGRMPAWLLAAGDASYATYLLHPFLVPVLAATLLPKASAGAGLWLLPGLCVGVSTLGGLALHRWVDRPSQSWLASMRRKGAGLSARGPGVSRAEPQSLRAQLTQTMPQLVEP